MGRLLTKSWKKIQEKFALFVESLTVIGLFGAILRTIGARLTKKCSRVDKLREGATYNYCYLKCKDILFGNVICAPESLNENVNIIWYCWWQGLVEAPDTIVECYKRLRELNGDNKIIVIDRNNYMQYVDIPEYMIEAAASGQLRLSHLCDILRFGLLYRYGGLWIDAGTYVNTALTEYLNFNIVSLRYPDDKTYRARGRWAGFFFGGKAGTLFFGVMHESLIRLHHSCGAGIEYLIMDYLIEVIYDNNESIAESFRKFPFMDYDLHEMQNLILQEDAVSVTKKATL
ncbi:MAG: capsular polysaccharide synthesis protein [Methylocystis sp.]